MKNFFNWTIFIAIIVAIIYVFVSISTSGSDSSDPESWTSYGLPILVILIFAFLTWLVIPKKKTEVTVEVEKPAEGKTTTTKTTKPDGSVEEVTVTEPVEKKKDDKKKEKTWKEKQLDTIKSKKWPIAIFLVIPVIVWLIARYKLNIEASYASRATVCFFLGLTFFVAGILRSKNDFWQKTYLFGAVACFLFMFKFGSEGRKHSYTASETTIESVMENPCPEGAPCNTGPIDGKTTIPLEDMPNGYGFVVEAVPCIEVLDANGSNAAGNAEVTQPYIKNTCSDRIKGTRYWYKKPK